MVAVQQGALGEVTTRVKEVLLSEMAAEMMALVAGSTLVERMVAEMKVTARTAEATVVE